MGTGGPFGSRDPSGEGNGLLSEREDLSDSCTEEEVDVGDSEEGLGGAGGRRRAPRGDDDEDDFDGEEEDDDFVCVPMSNIDKDTMTFKNSEKLKISLRGTDRIESGRRCDSHVQPYSSDRPGTGNPERYQLRFLQGTASQSIHRGNGGSSSVVGPPESLLLAQKRLRDSSDDE